MGLWQSLLGRSSARRPNLDSLFLVPSAAITLQTSAGFTSSGAGSVCFRGAGGAAFHQLTVDAVELIRGTADAPEVRLSEDFFGYTWLSTAGEGGDLSDLCTDLHSVNRALVEQGFDGGLLCTLIPFEDPSGRRFGLVYLYKQGTFYAFAPTGPRSRDNLLEIFVRDTLAPELPMEQDLQRWLAVWGAPGLEAG